MQQNSSTGPALAHIFQSAGGLLSSESEVIGTIIAELSASHGFVSNKAIILKLLEKLEQETDIIQLDIYRHALEYIVQQTPDDLV